MLENEIDYLDGELKLARQRIAELEAENSKLKAASVSEHMCARLDELLALKSGWDGYEGRSIDPDIVADAAAFLTLLNPSRTCFIAPLAHGGLQLEYDHGGVAVEVEFKSHGAADVLVVRNNN